MHKLGSQEVQETTEFTPKLIGHRIKEIRELKKITGKELALATNISQGEISKIEHGKLNPPFDFIERIAGVLDVTLDYIAGKEDADLSLREALARQSLKIFQRQVNLTSKEKRYVERVARTDRAPVTVDGWTSLLKNVTLWNRMRDKSRLSK
jgi:transcriptional regulator with XRE-family HTH domain